MLERPQVILFEYVESGSRLNLTESHATLRSFGCMGSISRPSQEAPETLSSVISLCVSVSVEGHTCGRANVHREIRRARYEGRIERFIRCHCNTAKKKCGAGT